MFQKTTSHIKIHFVGIGGIGMSGIAEILLSLGYKVSGSDLVSSQTTARLIELGAKIHTSHQESCLYLFGSPADVVVTSSAVKINNKEVVEAKRLGIPVIPRAEMLAELMRMKYGIAIAGSHGKTTTTSFTATILSQAGLDPTAVIGGRLPQLGSNARLGKSEYLVAEADESDGSFLHLNPTVAVVTNIDPEHLDHYKTIENLKNIFIEFINKVPFYGLAVVCLESQHVQDILPYIQKRFVTYGFSTLSDYRATNISFQKNHTQFEALIKGRSVGTIEIHMPGKHNVLNALAALAVSDFLEIPLSAYKEALATFQGVGRRFTIRGEKKQITVVDDYGHHPSEIRSTLDGARSGFANRRIIAIFQPHRYTRTRDLWNDFARAFNDADLVVLTNIYSAGEEPIPGINSLALAELTRRYGHRNVLFIPERKDIAQELKSILRANDLVITLGAGDIYKTCDEILDLIN